MKNLGFKHLASDTGLFVYKTKTDLHLCHALYGLKQAALLWWKELAGSMKKLGFKHLASDAGLFVYKTKTDLNVAVVYVDDAMFFGKNKTLTMQKKQEFMDTWECHDLGEVQEFL